MYYTFINFVSLIFEWGVYTMNILFKNLFAYQDVGLLIYRLGFGASMAAHGYLKFAGGEGTLTAVGSMLSIFGITDGFYTLGVMAAAAELLGGILLLLGLLTRFGALLVVGTLVVATAVGFSGGFMKWDYPSQMGLGALMLLIAGPGRYSIDRFLMRR